MTWKTPSVRKLAGEMETEFPNTLEGFGYRFNDRGQLRNIQTGKPFEFAVSTDATYNQKRYEALGKGLMIVIIKDGIHDTNRKRYVYRVRVTSNAKR